MSSVSILSFAADVLIALHSEDPAASLRALDAGIFPPEASAADILEMKDCHPALRLAEEHLQQHAQLLNTHPDILVLLNVFANLSSSATLPLTVSSPGGACGSIVCASIRQVDHHQHWVREPIRDAFLASGASTLLYMTAFLDVRGGSYPVEATRVPLRHAFVHRRRAGDPLMLSCSSPEVRQDIVNTVKVTMWFAGYEDEFTTLLSIGTIFACATENNAAPHAQREVGSPSSLFRAIAQCNPKATKDAIACLMEVDIVWALCSQCL
jgi:hypothetical protein